MGLTPEQLKALTIGSPLTFTFGGDVAHVFDPATGMNLEF